MVLKREDMLVACNKPKLVAYGAVYDYIWKYVYLINRITVMNHFIIK